MTSFLQSAGRKATDIRTFLREAANGNSMKYKPAKGQKHYIYVPYKNVPTINTETGVETVNKELIAIKGSVHEWNGLDGKYKATICLKDVIRQSEDGQTLINDGNCPFCDTVGKAWDIYRHRFETEEALCGKTGDELKKHLDSVKKTFADERKSKEAKEYIYILVAVYRTDPMKGNAPILENGIPQFDLKVMKLSASRVEKLQQQMENAGADFIGNEMVFEYPNEDDARLIVSQSTTAPVFESKQFIRTYEGLKAAIDAAVSKFEWEGLEKSFPEWSGMTSMEANKVVNELFSAWDEYQAELAVNPQAKYLEYVGAKGTTNPAIETGVNTASIPVATPNIPGVAVTEQAGASVSTIPSGVPDANELFGGPATPIVPGADEINI